MHRSVLQNKKYIKFAAANSVEVISMEEIERAERKQPKTIATYKTKDAYGDEVEYLIEFAGLTLDELKDLSNTQAILSFMAGGKIPYTAIVDPHTGKAMEAMKGKPTVKSLSAAISRARATLANTHGKGVKRDAWNKLSAAEVQCDLLLAADKYIEALTLHKKTAALFKRPVAPVKLKLDAMRASIEKDARLYLEAAKKNPSLTSAQRAKLAALHKALG